ncbi:MAG: phage tail protein, partial [Elusimicrobia bacterium]|nr:phage tail protein [Elusimicrobiota bacterium]
MTSLFGGGAKAVSKTPTRAMGIDLQGSQYGPPIPVVFGQNKVAGNVIWYGDFKATSHTQKQPGKGGGGSSSTSYTYSCSFELGLCEGVASVVNVYQGSSTVSLSRSGGIAFSGTTGQAAWSHLTGSAALGYSGTALAAFQNLELGSSASLPNFNFEVAARNQFGGGVVDANPADIVSAICTDTQIGVGFSALGDLTAFKNYCTAAGIFFSPVYSTQNPAHQTLDDLFKYANAAPFFSEGVLKVVPYGDATITGNGVTYTPSNTAVVDLGRDDFITNGPGDPVTIHRISPADAMNLVRVEYKDRANTYHTNAVVASIDQDVVGTGARAEQSESVDMITQAAVARLVAQNLLQRIYYIRNAYQFQLSWRYCYLEPMDVVTLTDANTGLYLTPVRITEIGEDEHGLLSVTAEEFPEGVSHGGTYGTQPNSATTVDPNADPGPIDAPYLFRGPGFLVSNAQPEIWCALTGNSALWAGCDVYISHDGTSYSYLATTSKSAAYGHLTNTLPSAADPDTTGAPNVVLNGAAQLLGGSTTDADQFMTLCMLDNELMAYATATLASGPSYTLGYL